MSADPKLPEAGDGQTVEDVRWLRGLASESRARAADARTFPTGAEAAAYHDAHADRWDRITAHLDTLTAKARAWDALNRILADDALHAPAPSEYHLFAKGMVQGAWDVVRLGLDTPSTGGNDG
jgi:hypothetical protein